MIWCLVGRLFIIIAPYIYTTTIRDIRWDGLEWDVLGWDGSDYSGGEDDTACDLGRNSRTCAPYILSWLCAGK